MNRMDVLGKAKAIWSLFVKGEHLWSFNEPTLWALNANHSFPRIDPTLIEVDAKSEQQIKKIQPDFREYSSPSDSKVQSTALVNEIFVV